MLQIFRDKRYFTVIFFLILGIDLYVKLSLPPMPFRYMSKPLVMLLLLGFYLCHQKEKEKKKFWWTIIGICCYFLADIFLINHLSNVSFILGMVMVIVGKSFYSLKFSHTADFKLGRLVPFLLVIFAYMSILFSFIYDNLGIFFIPVLFYFFVSLLMGQMAFLRKDVVNFKSYIMVLAGVELLVVGESVMALKMFYDDIPYQDIIVMLFYGLAQYLVISGLLKEELEIVSHKDI